MIKALLSFFRREFNPRWRRVVLSSQFIGSVAFVALFTSGVVRVPITAESASGLSGIVITYASIAFGFSLSTALVMLTLPRIQFLMFLRSESGSSKETSALEDLLFIFVWTGVVHWALIASTIVVWAGNGADNPLLPTVASWTERIWIGGWMGLGIYALAQFLVSIISLQQLGSVYIHRGLDKQ